MKINCQNNKLFSEQLISITFFKYKSTSSKWWAFQQMGRMPRRLQKVRGLQFSKMFGSGAKQGFGIMPNFGVYGLLSIWESEADAHRFFKENPIFTDFLQNTAQYWTIFLKTAKVHGTWDGVSPFEITTTIEKDEPVAVLTRATIRRQHLWRFWKDVPQASVAVNQQAACFFSIGIGELPLVQQATFSLWKSTTDMVAYAYQNTSHKTVVQKTRALGWYKEELFARFKPYDIEGEWDEVDMPQLRQLLLGSAPK